MGRAGQGSAVQRGAASRDHMYRCHHLPTYHLQPVPSSPSTPTPSPPLLPPPPPPLPPPLPRVVLVHGPCHPFHMLSHPFLFSVPLLPPRERDTCLLIFPPRAASDELTDDVSAMVVMVCARAPFIFAALNCRLLGGTTTPPRATMLRHSRLCEEHP